MVERVQGKAISSIFGRLGIFFAITFLVTIINGCESSKPDNDANVSKKFHKQATRVIAILNDIIAHADIYTEDERKFVQKFEASKYNAVESAIREKLISIKVDYLLNINFRNTDDARNKEFITKYLEQLNEVKKELDNSYKK